MTSLAKLSGSSTARYKIAAQIAKAKDTLTFGAFRLIAQREPSFDEYHGSRTRLELLRKAF